MQAEKKPTFDNIFISLESFHPEIAFFSDPGKMTEDSDGHHILGECKILGKGSINSFLKGCTSF